MARTLISHKVITLITIFNYGTAFCTTDCRTKGHSGVQINYFVILKLTKILVFYTCN